MAKELWHFTADWCPHCKRMAPLIADYMEKNPDVEYIKIDVEEDKDAADINQVDSLPTFLFFKKGMLMNRVNGTFEIEDTDSLFAETRK